MDINKIIKGFEIDIEKRFSTFIENLEINTYSKINEEWFIFKDELDSLKAEKIKESIENEGVDLNNITEKDFHITSPLVSIGELKIKLCIDKLFFEKVRPLLTKSLN